MIGAVGRTCIVLRCNLLPKLHGVAVSDTTLVPGQQRLSEELSFRVTPGYILSWASFSEQRCFRCRDLHALSTERSVTLVGLDGSSMHKSLNAAVNVDLRTLRTPALNHAFERAAEMTRTPDWYDTVPNDFSLGAGPPANPIFVYNYHDWARKIGIEMI